MTQSRSAPTSLDSYQAANTAFLQREYEKAAELYMNAISAGREDGQLGDTRTMFAYANLGNTHFALGQHQNAVDSYQEAINVHRTCGLSRVNAIIEIIKNLEKADEACTLYERLDLDRKARDGLFYGPGQFSMQGQEKPKMQKHDLNNVTHNLHKV